MRKVTPQSLAQYNSKSLIQRDKPFVEGSVMEARKAKAVAWIKTLVRKVSPRSNVTGDQQFRHVDATNATTHIVCTENRLSEKLLATSDLHDGRGFSLPLSSNNPGT